MIFTVWQICIHLLLCYPHTQYNRWIFVKLRLSKIVLSIKNTTFFISKSIFCNVFYYNMLFQKKNALSKNRIRHLLIFYKNLETCEEDFYANILIPLRKSISYLQKKLQSLSLALESLCQIMQVCAQWRKNWNSLSHLKVFREISLIQMQT